jgi:hypothetical protein
VYYELEYRVERQGPGGFVRRNASALAAYGTTLYTLNAQVPEARWGQDGPLAVAAAASFQLIV